MIWLAWYSAGVLVFVFALLVDLIWSGRTITPKRAVLICGFAPGWFIVGPIYLYVRVTGKVT